MPAFRGYEGLSRDEAVAKYHRDFLQRRIAAVGATYCKRNAKYAFKTGDEMVVGVDDETLLREAQDAEYGGA